MKKLSVILLMALAVIVMSNSVSAKNYCFCMGLSKCNTPNAQDIASAQYDAVDFKKALKKQGYKGSVIVNKSATRKEILKRVKNVVKAAKSPDDRIVLFFATHGHESGAFLTYGGDFIQYSEIIDILSHSKTKHIFVFVMACHSGSVVKGLVSDPNWSDNAAKCGITFITSSRPEEYSWSLNNTGPLPSRHSIFGHALVKGFRGQADSNNDRNITIAELYKYIYNEVTFRQTGNTNEETQHPQLIGPSSEHSTIIARW